MLYQGGFDYVEIKLAGRNAVAVTIDHGGNYSTNDANPDGWRFQLYANRRLIGVTDEAWQTRVVGQIPQGGAACPLGVLVVEPIDKQTDFGRYLDLRPFNVYRVAWSNEANPDNDTHHFDIVAGRNPGEEYDPTNVLARVPYTGRESYAITLPPFPAPGDWSIAVIPRDDAQPLGNAGDADELTIPAIVYPADFVSIPVIGSPSAKRFTALVEEGVLTADFTYATPGEYPT